MRVADRIAWITLNRPQRLNAWTPQLGHELLAALERAGGDPEVRVVVLGGAGRAFSAGADLKWMTPGSDGLGASVGDALRQIFNPLIMRVRTLSKPVIAAVNGVAAGIGCSLAAAADLIVAGESASFLLAFANIGLTLDGGASALLVGKVGHARASELALLAQPLPAQQAQDWGLVNRVVPDAELDTAVAALAAQLAAGAPRSYAAIKRNLNDAAYPALAASMDAEASLQQQLVQSADFVEGVGAFLGKRHPKFTGN